MQCDRNRARPWRVTPLAAGLAAGLFATACAAAPSAGVLEVGALHHSVTAGFGNWRHVFVRGNLRAGADDPFDAEIVRATRFGDSGTMLVLGDTHRFDELWHGSVSVAGSSGGFFFPQLRDDLTINRKWGARRQLVTTGGATLVNAKDGHRDRSVLLGLSIGPNALLVDLDSNTTTATWRKWLRPRQGFLQLRAQAYRNAFYARRGLEASVFQEF